MVGCFVGDYFQCTVQFTHVQSKIQVPKYNRVSQWRVLLICKVVHVLYNVGFVEGRICMNFIDFKIEWGVGNTVSWEQFYWLQYIKNWLFSRAKCHTSILCFTDSCLRREQERCSFLLFSRVFCSHNVHAFINSAEAQTETYLWLKLFSFLRQWRVTILWPSLLTSWLTVHTTGLLALAPRKATPSFSLTLEQVYTRNVIRNYLTHGVTECLKQHWQ